MPGLKAVAATPCHVSDEVQAEVIEKSIFNARLLDANVARDKSSYYVVVSRALVQAATESTPKRKGMHDEYDKIQRSKDEGKEIEGNAPSLRKIYSDPVPRERT